MKKIYEEWIDPVKALDRHKSTMALEDYLYYAREVVPIIASFDTMPSELRFLDFGMGWATWCMLVKAFGSQCYGTELSDTRITYAQSQGITVVPWQDLPSHSFHFINTEQVFEHLAEPFETLVYLKSCLHSDGILKISVPRATGIKKKLKIGDWNAPKHSKNSLNPVAPLEHINCFSYKSILKMAETAGLKRLRLPIKIQYAYSIYRLSLKTIAKIIVKPLYRNFFNDTYIFLCHDYHK